MQTMRESRERERDERGERREKPMHGDNNKIQQ